MRRARVGDIVVVMEPCCAACNTCRYFAGATALVTKAYEGREVMLQFAERQLRRDPVSRGGFHARNLYNTGLKA